MQHAKKQVYLEKKSSRQEAVPKNICYAEILLSYAIA